MNVAIIGCGYLGSEVAKMWTKKGYRVTATTRHPERLPELSAVAQKNIILKGSDEEALALLIANNEEIVITIGADDIEHYESAYLNTATAFRHLALEKSLPRRLLYTSSTSVYGDHNGHWVDETSELRGKTDQAKVLIETERLYLSLAELGWSVCILRLAELYGPGRELSKRLKQLQGHTFPGTGEYYTNLIHKTDAALAIDYTLRHHLTGIYNLVDDDHPVRKELYDQITQKFRLPKVKWDPALTGLHSGNKRISNHKIKSEGFSFHYPHHVLD